MLFFRAARSSDKSRRGFTLTEMVIVLGVFGGVIAAVMAASTESTRSIKSNQVIDQVPVIVDNVRSYYSAQSYPSEAAACASVFTDNTKDIALSTGIFPTDMIARDAASTKYVINPWGVGTSGAGLGGVRVALCKDKSSQIQIVVRYAAIPQEDCLRSVLAIQGPLLAMGLSQVYVWGASVQIFKINSGDVQVDLTSGVIRPSSPDLAKACTADANVDWYFKF